MPRVPLERQLELLAECGLRFVSDEALASCMEEWGRDTLEKTPFELVLVGLGAEFEDSEGQWHPAGTGVWHLDTECIYDAVDYVKAVKRLANLTRGDVRVEDIEAYFEDTAWVRFHANGEAVRWDLEVSDDWIDDSLIERFDGLLRAGGSARRICASESEGQDFLLVCPTREEYDRLTAVSPERFHPVRGRW